MIYNCVKCSKIATWMYMPSGGLDKFCCDDHVPRGCSCQTDDVGNDLKDDEGKLQPCCEWDYSKKGFRVYYD